MKTVFSFLFVVLMCSTAIAGDRIDEYPGLFQIKVGSQFSQVQHLFGSTLEKDVLTGKQYYALLTPGQSEYAEVLGAKIEKLSVYVVRGTIEEIVVVYPVRTHLSVITNEATVYYGEAPCFSKTQSKGAGGCSWNGERYSLYISNENSGVIIARYTRIQDMK